MARDALARVDDPLDGLRTVHLIEEALVQRGLRQLRELLKDAEGRRILDDISANALSSIHDLEEILAAWTASRGTTPVRSATVPEPDRGEILRSFIDLKETESAVLRRASKDAPPEHRAALARLADAAERHAEGLARLLPPGSEGDRP
ncbi:MAG TPA: hypothetical protein VI997_06865 [Candidatus Thermoplasmatota archaeon]|nr:hypothetical protein [Candidatus Thermoplasmatota archaeon]